MLQSVVTVLLFFFVRTRAENTSADKVELIPVVSRFSPDSNILHSGRQVFRDITESKGIVKVADNFYEEYFYDDNAVISPKPQESIERTTVGSTEGTTTVVESTAVFQRTEKSTTVEASTDSSTRTEPATIIPTIAPVFATLLVSPVPFHPTTIVKPKTESRFLGNQRPTAKPTYLKSGDVFHARLDVTEDEFSLKQRKKPDWLRIWKSLRPKKRTIVSNTVGVVPDNLPPPPPGAVLIEVPQVRAKRKTNRDSQEGTNSQKDYPIPITKDRIFYLPSRARPLRRIATEPLALTAPVSSPLTSNQLWDSYSIYRKKFDQALQALNTAEDDVDQLDAEFEVEKHSRSHLGPILKIVTI